MYMDYKQVSKIPAQAEIQYFKTDNGYFINLEEFKAFIKQNNNLDTVLESFMENKLIRWNVPDLIKKSTKKGGGHSGRNPEKYPIPSTAPEKTFTLINPIYRCNGNKKSGRCVWVARDNGYCKGCVKNNLVLDLWDTTRDGLNQFKQFSKKPVWNAFVEKYFVDGVFNMDLYNKDQASASPDPTPRPEIKPTKSGRPKKVK